MKPMHKNILFGGVVFVVVIALLIFMQGSSSSHQLKDQLTTNNTGSNDEKRGSPVTHAQSFINEKDLTKAGFTNIQYKESVADATYFFVDVPRDATTTTANDMLMVSLVTVPKTFESIYNYPESHPVTIGNVSGLEGVEGNRTTIDFVKSGQYVTIIGPGKDKDEKLASIIFEKIQ